MRVWFAREQEVRMSLWEARPHSVVPLYVLGECVAALPLDGQRMTKTQAEIACDLGIDAPTVSRAFKALAAVGVVMLPQRSKHGSQTWEVDAEYASRLSDEAREREIARQAREVNEARAAAARKQRAKTGLREVPFPGRDDGEQACEVVPGQGALFPAS